jgi:(R,R)-butanediol dehydrogenase/meso-butanediol dehydrogenase/diacetyl reductase
MSVSFSGVLRSGIEAGQAALVLGAGPIGIGVTLGLRAIGVDDITVVEPASARRAAVAAMGVDVLGPDVVDIATEVRRRTDGRGVDAVFDCAGAATTFSIAPAVLRRGRYVILASVSSMCRSPWLLLAPIELTGSCGYNSKCSLASSTSSTTAYLTAGWVDHVGLDDVTNVLPSSARAAHEVLVDLS